MQGLAPKIVVAMPPPISGPHAQRDLESLKQIFATARLSDELTKFLLNMGLTSVF